MGRININTAPAFVLAQLPWMSYQGMPVNGSCRRGCGDEACEDPAGKRSRQAQICSGRGVRRSSSTGESQAARIEARAI